jgi:hypothetical protein
MSMQSARIIAIVAENSTVGQQLVSELYEDGVTEGYA